MFFENRASWRSVTLFRICQAASMAITMVLPEPVAILEQSRRNRPPSPGTSIPCRSAGLASISQISVSMASNWQKKNRR